MQYKLVVDKQSRLNPSTEKKIYTLDIEELRAKGNISDKLIISPSESYVIRNLSLSEYHVLKVLENPIKEVIENPKIELFEGDNYIYLIDMVGNRFYAEYLIKNEFNDVYPTKTEMHAAINLVENAINLEVAKKVNDEDLTGANLLLRINGDKSEAKLKADKIGLEGYTTINNGFSVDTEGNASIANDAVKINRNGIQMADGTSLIGGKGIFTILSFRGISESYDEVVGQGEFKNIGFNAPFQELKKCNYYIDVFIPQNFVVQKAYLTIQHLPLIVYENTTLKGYGVCKQMKFYSSSINNKKLYVKVMSDSGSSSDTGLNEISVLGENGWTPTIPTSEDSVSLEEKIVEIPITNFTSGKINRFALSSSINTPTVGSSDNVYTIGYLNSGAIIGTINLIGFSKDINFN